MSVLHGVALFQSFTCNICALISRLISFAINMYLLRRINGDLLGVVNVRYFALVFFNTIFAFLFSLSLKANVEEGSSLYCRKFFNEVK
uniref:Protein RFT1 homolog n=1 Tax=Parascaris equorum TaxID=6256 RepID=A0A914R5M1_PAREQ